MNEEKLKKLKDKGFEPTTVEDFLGMSEEEVSIMELRLALSRGIKNRRVESKMTQDQLAKLLETSQSRVAKMEAGDESGRGKHAGGIN